MKELQNDISQYQLELEKHKQQASVSDKNRSQLVQDLTQQNERLTEQIKKVGLFSYSCTILYSCHNRFIVVRNIIRCYLVLTIPRAIN